MLGAAALALAGVGFLWAGADWLVRGSSALASRFGLTPLVIGLTVVAFGTSAPELVVSVGAALDNRGALAVGNAVGSNIVNVGLIFGVLALIRPPHVHAQSVRVDMPILLFVSLLLVVFLRDAHLSRPEGLVLLAGLTAFVLFSLRTARFETEEVQAEYTRGIRLVRHAIWADAALVVAGLALLVLGGRALVTGAVTLASTLGMSEAAIGLTVVALGTSLPELATTAVAAFKGESDIAVGNIVGSSIFNILGILGAAAIVKPLDGSGIHTLDLAVMSGLAVVLLPLMRTGFRVARWEGGMLLIVYAAYTAYLVG